MLSSAPLTARDLLPFPRGSNSSDTLINGVHFNLTVLEHWNYTLYDNGTLSNGSKCYLTIDPWIPDYLYPNGTFVNSTSCYNPVDGIGSRAAVGIGFGVAFGICLIGVLVNLNKHGRLHLPAEKRFTPVSRRWQWYWCIFVLATAFVSLFTNIDVDRFRVMGIPIILNSFFWLLMQQGVLALVWEAVRHWGSWQERQFIDPNPFMLRDDDRRSKIEFWLPLWFYMWLWLDFFLVVPRSWGQIQLQRSPDQTASRAAPAATDARFKAAAFCLLVCWLTICGSLRHSIKHYKPRNRGVINKTLGLLRFTPVRFRLMIPLALIAVVYQILISFSFPNSVLNARGNLGAIYAGGYGPALLILVVQIIWGFMSTNEDKLLIQQRRRRGEEMDREMGIVRKPAWWRRVNDAMRRDPSNHLGGGSATSQGIRENIDTRVDEDEAAGRNTNIEMEGMETNRSDDSFSLASPHTSSQTGLFDASSKVSALPTYRGMSDRRRKETTMEAAARALFPDAQGNAEADEARATRRAEAMQGGESSAHAPAPPPYSDQAGIANRGETDAEASGSANTGAEATPQPKRQRIKSMLDV